MLPQNGNVTYCTKYKMLLYHSDGNTGTLERHEKTCITVKDPSQLSAFSALVLCKKPKTGVVASSAIKSIKVSDYHEETMLQSYLNSFLLDLRPLSSIDCEGFESVISAAIELGAYYNGNITCRDLMPPRNKVRSALDSVSEFQLLN